MIRSVLRRLPPGVKRGLRGLRATLSRLLMRIGAQNGFLASVYFCLCSRRFYREHLAVLRGRLKFEADLHRAGATSPFLRRNIHRIEKGLVMTPRRPVFGEGFIVETVRAYALARDTAGFSAAELQWAGDVLEAYFSVVSDTPVIREARLAFGSGSAPLRAGEDERLPPSTPYPRRQSPETDISFDQLRRLFERRRSVRWYLPKQVPADLVMRAIEAAAQAPSACNRQAFRFMLATDPDWASRIAACAGGTGGFSQQLPAIIVVVGDLSAYRVERDRHLIYIDAALASMQLMLAAETLGLATCPINWPDVDSAERRIQELLGLPAHERVIMLVAIGYADPEGGVPYSQKKQRDLLVQEFPPA